MPIYEYQCKSCNKIIETLQKMSDPPLTECPQPKCNGKLKRLISQGGFHLKGDGWYVTDYKKPNTPKKETESNNE